MRFKYKFENPSEAKNATNYNNRKYAKKKEIFPTMIINNKKGEFFETSNIHEIGLLIINIEIDDVSNIFLFTEKQLNHENF